MKLTRWYNYIEKISKYIKEKSFFIQKLIIPLHSEKNQRLRSSIG
jgi:hypothetical protein